MANFLKRFFRKKMDKGRVRKNVEELLGDEDACQAAAAAAFQQHDKKGKGSGYLDDKEADRAINTLVGAKENEKGIPKHVIKDILQQVEKDTSGITEEQFIGASWNILNRYHEKELAKAEGKADSSSSSSSSSSDEE
ncbi:uncharacterized protein LOC118407046 [Branchiostoma floridae]|uniref:Uncharacterized protein LOC118407046 n=1 Tax=Branchiostoma floridae TaxID=7739 RepID=A0A9J7HSP7_BRAFL|nr:uncharacterized protein LOC118407046 [Branchiostoma floridae]XP_035663367.1 uncharacterized protein LOC118407046 [Branchiostoma floridae]